MNENTLLKKIINCTRCGGMHENVVTMKLTLPVLDESLTKILYTHWAPCPINGEPILSIAVEKA